MSADVKVSRRRDDDPVRVYSDGRVAWWTGGKPGVGDRKIARKGSQENAETYAEELRTELCRAPAARGPKGDATLAEMVQDLLDTLRAEHAPEGTVRQYKSDWNAHMADSIGTVRCREAATWHYRQVFSRLLQEKTSQQVMRNVARTLGVAIDFGEDNGYFGTEEPFGSATRRTRIAEKYRKRARIAGAEETKRITLDVCPSAADIDEYAAAFEKEYPGYGARLVWLAFATGLRFCELLALRWDCIDLVTLDVAVDWQLDRYGNWPDVKPPKNGKRRTTRLWRHYFDVAASLVADALAREGEEHGWLFPRHRSVTKWADRAGHLATAAAESCDWDWTFHWTRHAYASWNLASKAAGGYEVHPKKVQKRLGHARLSTTLDTYVHEPPEDDEEFLEETRRPPGQKAA